MNEKIRNHIIAGEKLDKIKNKAFKFIKENLGKIKEYEVREFILKEFKKENLKLDKNNSIPIVAVNKNCGLMHYFPNKSSKIIGKNSLVLIDIWARFKDGYFADITWMGYSGKVPKKVEKTFNQVIKARDSAVSFIKKELKKRNFIKGQEVDKVVRDYFEKHNIEKYFIHGTGHSLGLRGCHGKYFNLSKKNKKRIKELIPFTIEPGIYFKNKYGIRSEINCYIQKNKLIINEKIQRKIVKI